MAVGMLIVTEEEARHPQFEQTIHAAHTLSIFRQEKPLGECSVLKRRLSSFLLGCKVLSVRSSRR